MTDMHSTTPAEKSPEREGVSDLAPQQYMDMYQELDTPLSDVRGSALRMVVYGAIAFLLLFIILGSIITIPRHLQFPFVLKGSMQERIYRFPDNVYIDALYVRAGGSIRRGDPMIGVTSPRIASLVGDYNEGLRKRELFERSELPLYEARRESARLRQERLGSEIAETEEARTYRRRRGENELRSLAADADHARKVYESHRTLHASGSVSDLELKGAEARHIAAAERLRAAETGLEGEDRSLASRSRQLMLDRDMAAESVRELDAEIAGRRASLEEEIATARSAIELNYGSFRISGGGIDLLAPADGVVSFLFDGERELPSGAILLKLMAGDSSLYALAQVPPELIGYIEPGKEVALEVSTFPHYRWGVAHGAVASVSLTPDEKGAYPLRVAIDSAGALEKRLRIGMTGEMAIAVEERSLFDILFEKVSGLYDTVVGN